MAFARYEDRSRAAAIGSLYRAAAVGIAEPRKWRGDLPSKVRGVSCANGAGVSGSFPPLWGARSFNNGAGMAHIDRMTGFVRYNMPQNAPGSLSLQDAYDVAGFVLSHARPHFQAKAEIQPSTRNQRLLLKTQVSRA